MEALVKLRRQPSPAVEPSAPALELDAIPRGLDDGDTYVIHFRSQGIDTPEKRQLCERANGTCYPCGQEAKKALRRLVTTDTGKFRKLKFKIWTVGTYGRPVVTAYADGRDVHLALLEQGWAVAYRRYLPDALRDGYLAAEAQAKAAKRGLWRGRFVEPRKWRRGLRLPCEK